MMGPESENQSQFIDDEKLENEQRPVAFSAQPAGFWVRVLAAFIDGLVLLPVAALHLRNMTITKSLPLFFLTVVPNFLYKPLMQWRYGATLGKMAVGLVVVDEDGHLLSIARAYLRFLPNLLLGAVSVAGTLAVFGTEAFRQARSLDSLGELQIPAALGMLQGVLAAFVLADCLAVVFTLRKRAIHDFMADSYCVIGRSLKYRDEPEEEGDSGAM